MDEIEHALEDYHLDCGRYPSTLKGLVEKSVDCAAFRTGGYFNGRLSVPKDPYGCDLPYSSDGTSFTLKSLGKNCMEGGEGAESDILFDKSN